MKSGITINKKTNRQVIPLYSRVESFIRNRILSGYFEAGEKLPKEDDFLKQFGVSKITIRNALARLESEGLIRRNPGKGTFVADTIPVNKQFIVTGAIHNIVLDAERYDVKPFGIKTMKIRESRNPQILKNFFSLTKEDEISCIRRARLLKGTPIYYLENFMRPEIASHITTQELSKMPLLKIIKNRTNLVVGAGKMYIEAIPAEPDIAEIIGCQTYDPLILLQVYYWFPSKEPFEVVNCFMRSEYFKYEVDVDLKGFENI